ncbi:MAG: hypothetical protein AB7Q00_12935 [Phycisphaerales bacterium]
MSPRSDFMAWAKVHADVFENQYAAVGLSQAQAAAFRAAYDAADLAIDEQDAAKFVARSATSNAAAQVDILQTVAGATVNLIRAFAEITNNETVYDVAQIPRPATPGPIPAPTTPTDLKAAFNLTTGAITISWKATQPQGASGTSYNVFRKAQGETDFTNLGSSTGKSFVDNTFFAGPDSVQYAVQAVRSSETSQLSAALVINFGRVNSGNGSQSYAIESTTTAPAPAPIGLAA